MIGCCSVAKSCPILCDLIDCSTPGFPVLHYLPEFAQTHVCWVGCYSIISSSATLFSFCLQSFQHQGLFQRIDSSHQVAKVLELQLQHQSLNEYSELISLSIDWFDLLAVQGTLKSFLQHHSLKASILWHSAFFMEALTSIHDYWKNYRFDYTDLCQQVMMSLLFNTLSKFVIALLPRSKCLLISRLQALSSVILEPKKIKSPS